MKNTARFCSSAGTIVLISIMRDWGIDGWHLYAIAGWMIAIYMLSAYEYGSR